MELALEAGAEDVTHEEGGWSVTTAPEDFLAVKEAIDGAGLETSSAELTMVPTNDAAISGDDVGKVLRLIDTLEDHDDVQKVYTNMDASAEDLAAAMG
jgi:transcriptional/translational regulatory protein YebC/TACO1